MKRINVIKIAMSFIVVLGLGANVFAADVDDWNGLGGNATNDKTTITKTAIDNSDMQGKVVASGQLKDPIVVNDKIYAVSGSTLKEWDKDGNELRSVNLKRSAGFFSKIAYGDNKIYVALSDRIQAIDLDSFESIWMSEQTNYQYISSILYYDKHIYTGVTDGGIGTASDGMFFAINVEDEDTSKTDEVKPYTWTYKQENLNGHYWSDATVANGAIIFAGDSGMLVSHHPTKDIVFAKMQLGKENEANKVRTAIVYNKRNNRVIVATQDSKLIYSVELNNQKFDFSTIKSAKLNGEVSGGIASTDTRLYIPSGGVYGNGFTVLDHDLNPIYHSKKYGTQSYPLISTAYATKENNNKVYVYFMDYTSGKMIRMEDDDSVGSESKPKEVKFNEYVDKTNLEGYNSSSLIANSHGDLIILSSGFMEGKIVTYKNIKAAFKKEEIENLIARLPENVTIFDKEEILTVEKRVSEFEKNENTDSIINKDRLISKKEELNTVINNDIALYSKKLLEFKEDDTSKLNEFYKMYGDIANLDKEDQLKITNYERVNELMDSYDSLNPVILLNNEISEYELDKITASSYEPLKIMIDKYEKLSAEDKFLVTNAKNLMACFDKAYILKSKDDVKKIETDYVKLGEVTSLKDEKLTTELHGILGSLHKTVLEELDVSIVDKINSAYTKVVETRAIVKQIEDDIWSITPGKVTLGDEAKLKSILANYNKLSAEDKKEVKHWDEYAQLKKEFDNIKIKVVKSKDRVYTYTKISNKWLISKLYINNASTTRTINYRYNKSKCNVKGTYNCVSKVTDNSHTKKNRVITKKQYIKYNNNAQVTYNAIQYRNKKGRYVTTTANYRTYHKNKRVRSNKYVKRNVNTNKYTSIRQTNYYTNAKKQRYTRTNYKAGKRSSYNDYRYNRRGQLKSNKHGKASHNKRTYNKKGKLIRNLKYKYNAKGKKSRR